METSTAPAEKEKTANAAIKSPDLKGSKAVEAEDQEKGKGEPEQSSVTAAATAEEIKSASAVSLIEALGLAGKGERSLQGMLQGMQTDVSLALQELIAITTHDDNLERQYKEVVSENTKLHSELEKARNEIRHLRGQLSIIQMTPSEIREEKARAQLREKRRQEKERLIEQQRAKGQAEGTIYVPTAAERARTVDAKGNYVDHRLHRHTRSSTYPTAQTLPSLSPQQPGKHGDATLPPPLVGCACSECKSKQSLGALTLGKGLCQRHLTNQITKSGQQILLGDKVIIRGERLGVISYIGKLDFDPFDQIYIGVHLDMPVGNSNGTLKGRRYFQCPPNHGVFVKPIDIICVTGRKPLMGGTAVPRVRERLPMGILKMPSKTNDKELVGGGVYVQMQQSLASTTPSSRPESTITRAKTILQDELKALKQKSPYDLVDDSTIMQMSERMQALSQKQKSHDPPKEPATPTTTPITETDGAISPLPAPSLGISSQPLPPISETNSHHGTTPPSRVATPLEKTLLDLLSDVDLGATGYVTAPELKATLIKLGKLSPESVTDLLTRLDIDGSRDDGIGLPYHTLLPHLLTALQ